MHRHSPCLQVLVALALTLAVAAPAAAAKFRAPEEIPAERLLKNLNAYLKEHPKDPEALYLLGRVHGYVFAAARQTVPAYDAGSKSSLPKLSPRHDPSVKRGAPSDLEASIKFFREAIRLKPKSGLYHLGLAWIITEGIPLAKRSLLPLPGEPTPKGKLTPELVRDQWRERAIQEHLLAHDLASAEDLKIETKPLRGIGSLVSYEAGSTYRALVESRGERPTDRAALERVKRTLAALQAKPRGPITPIVFSLQAGASATLEQLLAPGRSARFDLDGDGRVERWPWLRSDTALLVWDPAGVGTISSGRQLLGSVTWWMFWRDGYHALDALDDDRDGKLSGAELRGLAAWFDRNGNGRSDPGEVVPLASLGVRALSTRADAGTGDAPRCQRGLELTGGRALPTFDWTPSSLERP